LLRAFGAFAALLAILNVVLLSAFDRIAPQNKIEAFFVQTADDEKQTIYVQSAAKIEIKQDSLGQRIAKGLIMKYISDRETMLLEPSKMQELIGPESDAFYMSSPEAWNEFSSGEAYRTRMLNPSRQIATIEITPDRVQYMSTLNTWEAVFTLTTMDANGTNRKSEPKIAEVAVKFDPYSIDRNGRARWRNPLGFKVVKYETRK
ncbi:MAG: type IV secretion system protein, partial [Rickettsiales bacterium]|nr:type IV secretion system protein [Rickettsiales bacterium]